MDVAFHPNYKDNRYFYINYVDKDRNTVVARYTTQLGNPNVADPNSAKIILTINEATSNHWGGQTKFGPDGYLYLSVGDGGPQGDPNNNAQNRGNLLGTMLRIDVDGGDPYTVPASNPFTNVSGAKGEIWAYGLRNPWRFSFDRATGDLFIGDVGYEFREEINFQPASSRGGENYGWRQMEGSACYNPGSNCNDGTLVLPILEYATGENCSVTGGYRYRGDQMPELKGTYIYGDYCSGRIWGATLSNGRWTSRQLLKTPYSIVSFGEDEAGEIYLADFSQGGIYRLEAR
jgi:glucose/arabinose dehydrogenase